MGKLQDGGTLVKDALYVERSADEEATAILRSGELCLILGSRQTGKSSLALRSARHLAAAGRRCAYLNLNGIGGDNVTPSEWFYDLAAMLASQLRLTHDWEPWWQQQAEAPVNVWSRFLRERVLTKEDDAVTILFIDETDDLPSRGSWSDDFFASIRAAYNDRAEDSRLQRLVFCLIGSRPPAWLIRDLVRTPFNIGRTVLLRDFTLEEMRCFLPAIHDVCADPESVILETARWTSGQPYMTARILVLLIRGASVPAGRVRRAVQDAVNEAFLREGLALETMFSEAQERCLSQELGASPLAKLQLYELLLEHGRLDLRRDDSVQLSLRLAGLAGEERTSEAAFLIPRNEIFATHFDSDWVKESYERLLSSQAPIGKPSVAERSAVPGSVQGKIDELFCNESGNPYGSFERRDAGEELIGGKLFHYKLKDLATGEMVSLQAFAGVRGIAGELWEQEVRALERLSGRKHPTLPEIRLGGFDEEKDLAFVLTASARYTLEEPGAMESLRADKVEALRQLALLAEGLSLLHSGGLVHRNLWNGSVEVLETPGRDRFQLRLARFEMSTMVSNLLRRVDPAHRREYEQANRWARDYFPRQGRMALACSPPERLEFIFEQAEGMLESARGDVYSLGILAYQWFVGPLPEEALLAAFPDSGPERVAGYLRDAYGKNFHEELLRRIGRARLPRQLEELLRGMLAVDPRTRSTSWLVVDSIARNYDALALFFAPGEKRRYLLAYLPLETGQLLRNWGFVIHDPATQEGRAELHIWLENDLRGGELSFSATGFTRYSSGETETRFRSARYVLSGREVAYFATPYVDRLPWQKEGGVEVPQVLLIAFTKKKREVQVGRNLFRRSLPPFELIPVGSEELKPEPATAFPSWEPLRNSVEQGHLPPWHQTVEDALGWLLRLDSVRIKARLYPIEVIQGQDGPTGELRLDELREKDWVYGDSLLFVFATDKRRQAMGDFFAQVTAETGTMILFRPDYQGAPGERFSERREGRLARAELGSIWVNWKEGPDTPLPRFGWVQPADDEGSRYQLERQSQAVVKLLQMPMLLDQLKKPTAGRLLRQHWADAGKGLLGDAPKVIRRMLDSRPFFALHGPPGTGKTTVAAHAVTEQLKADQSLRILVSAQSHFSLDNLAERILEELSAQGQKLIASIRIASPDGRLKVSEPMRRFLPEALARQTVDRIKSEATKLLSDYRDRPRIANVIARWKELAEDSLPEIKERLKRGANLVFSTTGTATEKYLGLESDLDSCDWVIVEEAAKAWPTELAMPLVQGVRWTLIGDHRQLPAFGRSDVEAILDECAQSGDEELHQAWENRTQYLEVFDAFATLFRAAAGASSPAGSDGAQARPVERLTTQFRMRRSIGDTVSNAFYEDALITHPKAEQQRHQFEAPGWIKGQSLLWIDTSGLLDAQEEPRWQNRREADVVRRIVLSLRPRPHGEAQMQKLSVLSPYLAQVERLQAHMGPEFRDCVHSVDSFQGKEADVVIVSLVRNNEAKTARLRLGFLAFEPRINVIFSRARCLLLIVGSYTHFKDSGIPFWNRVCASVYTRGGGIEKASKLGLVDKEAP